MKNNKGFTLSEVLIGSFIFAVVSMMFTSGLLAVVHIFGKSDVDMSIEAAADEIMLTGNTDISFLDGNLYNCEYLEEDYTATITGPGMGGVIIIGGQAGIARISYEDQNGGDITAAERFRFIFERIVAAP
jgi:prepilin-type N-terminal cleavage/methylation domain-containing protein